MKPHTGQAARPLLPTQRSGPGDMGDPGPGHPNNLHPHPQSPRASSGSGKLNAPQNRCTREPAWTRTASTCRDAITSLCHSGAHRGSRGVRGVALASAPPGHRQAAAQGHTGHDGVPGDAPCSSPGGGEEEEGRTQGWARALLPPAGLCPLSPSGRPGTASPRVTGGEAPTVPIAQRLRAGARRSQAGASASPGRAGKPWSCPLPAPTFGDGRPPCAAHPPGSLPSSCRAASPLPGAGQPAPRGGEEDETSTYPALPPPLPLLAGTAATGGGSCPVPQRLLRTPTAARGVRWQLPRPGAGERPRRQLRRSLAGSR